jgi:predicted  nucleic acid-binding Zn-ribbon protein
VATFDDLMVVQEHDTTIDQLRHRRANLPELAELTRLEADLAALEGRLADVTARRDEVARRQSRLEDELAGVEGKVKEIDGRLYSGAITIPRELQALQADVESLRRRCSTLEDAVLEAMTEGEPLDDEIRGLEAARAELDGDGSRLRVAVAEAESAIDAQLAAETEARQEMATGIPADVARLYEDLRRKLGGVGAARLVQNRCTGCHLTLPATEVDRIRREPPDALITCEQCGRILVR